MDGGEKLGLCDVDTGESWRGLTSGVGGRSLLLCVEKGPRAALWFTRGETEEAHIVA